MVYHQIIPSAVPITSHPSLHLVESKKLNNQQVAVIENYVSHLHECFFDNISQSSSAGSEYAHLPVHEKLKALHAIASCFAKSIGANEDELQKHVYARSIYCYYNKSLGKINAVKKAHNTPVLLLEQSREEIA